MKRLLTLLTILLCLCLYGQKDQSPMREDNWKVLFNGKNLDGWESYLGPRYNEQARNFIGERMGLNNDPDSVFTIVEENREQVIRISGEHFGCIATKEEFENYHLQVQFKWGQKKSAPRKNSKRDSGVLYHSHGPHGVGWFFWMAAQEFQVEEGDCGDYWSVLSDVDAKVTMNADSTYTYNKNGENRFFGPHGGLRGHVIRSEDAEKPLGEWNTLDLYTFGASSIHRVNGKTVMVLTNSRQKTAEELLPLTKGKIQLQSEGAEVFYKNVRLEKIKKLPDIE